MKIDKAENAVVLSLQRYPVLNRPEIVPDMDITCRLNARKHTLFHR
jgi:hypothetical protein